MPSLLERLRDALAPHYTVERELASGGMGMVFLGRDVALQRRVAIKIIRPELATAHAAERFLREARILASLSHPNIVPVHHVGEAGGFFYYVMDCVQGETLADRLAREPLRPSEAVKLGRDLLDALEAAHRLGVVHRDIKPSNVFLLSGRSLLVDFGIAKPSTEPGHPRTTPRQPLGGHSSVLTAPGSVIGTLDYMPPEQAAGAEVTPRTDLYAIGMVLYEALTGRHWPSLTRADRAEWSGVPRGIARVLRRALEWKPEDRWRDAASFRRALWRTRTRRYVRRTIGLTIGGLVLGGTVAIALYPVLTSPAAEPGAPLRFRIEPFVQHGAADRPALGDTLARTLARNLSGYADFTIAGPGDPPSKGRRAGARLSGVIDVTGDSLRVEVRSAPGSPASELSPVVRSGLIREWAILADSLAYDLLTEIWRSPLDSSLPRGVLPKTRAGMEAFLRAERLFAEARWTAAGSAYEQAEAVDSTCWMCSWRRDEVGAWYDREEDASRTARYIAHVAAFPPRYQSLIRATRIPLRARLDTLRAATRQWPHFFLAWFKQGDELFHRGPLVGHSRAEAVASFRMTTELQPDFAPAWEHLGWALTAEGDAAGAKAAWEALTKLREPRDPSASVVQALLQTGLAWRFQDTATAGRLTRQIIRQPEIASYPDFAAGPRYLPTFDAPRGAIELGRLFAASRDRPALERSGLIAQVFGYLALGKRDSARALARRIAERFPERDLALFALELDGALLLLDAGPEELAARWPSLRGTLRQSAELRAGSDETRRRAAWMYTLLSRRAGDSVEASRYATLLEREPAPRSLLRLLQADARAARGNWAQALDVSDTLTSFSATELSAVEPIDPFFRSVLHLRRAEWYEKLGKVEDALSELLWYQNLDEHGRPTRDPQVGEVDWAFATVARWRIATLLDRFGDRPEEACRAYGAVQQLWSLGEPRFRARADSAARRLGALTCRHPT